MPRISSAKTAPIVANWSRCSARQSAFAPASIRTDGPVAGRDRDGDRGPAHAGEAPQQDEARGEHRARVARRTRPRRPRRRRRPSRRGRASCPPSCGTRRRASRPCRRPASSATSVETARVEAGRAEDDRLDAVGARRERALDDRLGTTVAAHRVDGNPAMESELYGAWVRSGSTSRPLYVPQVGQTRCGRFGWPHVRADVDLRRLDLVRRTPLVAARLGGFPLRDGHAAGHYSLSRWIRRDPRAFDEQMRRRAAPDSLYVGNGWSAVLWPPDDGDVEPLVARMREIPGHVEWKYYSHDGPELRERLLAAGLEPEDEETVVVAEAASIAPPPADVELRVATDAFVELAERVFGRSHGSGLPEVSVAVVACRRRAAGLGRAGRLRARRRVRRPVRRRHAARVPRARALSRDGREARGARARARLPLALRRRAADEPADPRAARLRRAHDDDAVRHSSPQLAELLPARVESLLRRARAARR